ncbi:methyltransferase domain-containing protein [Dictyobacter kobayashii]|uniref:Protein-L-isoaspartate O-methyltransferase n=1 Tax=Dictyobacter kobayashii TaxID=2014872 RepID=A0A402AT04_9CHLR|nr:methyltransferase domain-containing protein [Dictyobacter kobayashii]GCE22234.1 hypothetical protein KDK_60340 [Dictyobacter kobayashii]
MIPDRSNEDYSIEQYRTKLQKELSKYSVNQNVLEAFARIPRHVFIDTFYLPRPAKGQTPQWVQLSPQMNETEWLEAVYRDEPVVTQIAADGHASSSSSKPSVMAAMLEELHVQPGQKVLEIGTGTGWNAVLLAELTSDPALVTTIDIDEDLVYRATQRICASGGDGMTILVGDGREGYAPNAPYDRIIATGSYPFVPFAWIDQLAPGGLLVVNVKTWYVSMMLIICRDMDTGEVYGKILDNLQGEFMRLHGGEGVDHRLDRSLYPREPIFPIIEETWDYEYFHPDLLTNEHFKFFVWLRFPQMYAYRIGRKNQSIAFYYLHDLQSGKRLQFNMVGKPDIRGDKDLWNDLQNSIDHYHALNYPTCEDFCLHFTETEQYFEYIGIRWPIAKR